MDTKVAAKPAVSKRQPSSEKAKKSKPKLKSTHPPVSKMVIKAIENLNQRGGSSVKAIKKHVAANFMVDAEKVTPFIKKYLTKAVENKTMLQTKGKGFNGSFKLAPGVVKKKDPVKRHVTASGTSQEDSKMTKKTRKSSTRVARSASKQQSREGPRDSMERTKTSKISTFSTKADKVKA